MQVISLIANVYPLNTIQGHFSYYFETGEAINTETDEDGDFNEVAKIDFTTLPASTFTAPSHYTKITMADFYEKMIVQG